MTPTYQFRDMKPGETLICARLDAGDMVIVNRMAYHFRKPERGETFVFDTRGINTNVPCHAGPKQRQPLHQTPLRFARRHGGN